MKTTTLLTFLIMADLISCSPDHTPSTSLIVPQASKPGSVAPNEDLNALTRQFHGKYKVISSVSSEPVDVNADGMVSTNLMTEISELTLNDGKQYTVEIRIYGPSPGNPNPSFLFAQWWPEQFIRTGSGKVWDGEELLAYHPAYPVSYDLQGAIRRFSLSADLKSITVNPSEPENAYRWVRPQSVTVEDNGQLRVINKRRLYTRSGVKEVVITTRYERFTLTT